MFPLRDHIRDTGNSIFFLGLMYLCSQKKLFKLSIYVYIFVYTADFKVYPNVLLKFSE